MKIPKLRISFSRPALRVTTYRVDPATGERTEPVTRWLRARGTAERTTTWPPCECPRHRGPATP